MISLAFAMCISYKAIMKRLGVKKALSVVLAAGITLSSIVTTSIPTVFAAEDTSLPTLTVDMTPDEERPIKHASSGWLYGLGDNGVPSVNTITPLKPHTTVQKAPNGMQHPNGDVLDIADTFLNAGGQDIQVYVPDYYALWFYEFSSTEEYLDILRMQAEECIKKGIAEDVVYVLYNEPKADWIGGSYTDPETGTVSYGWESLFWFWEDMYNMVVDIYEENGVESKPRFAGLNLMTYDGNVMDNYIKFCVEHSCMPDVITWHDLSTWGFNNFGNEYHDYRALEEKYLTEENAEKYGIDITPREIIINEYGDKYEMGSPGDLIRWIGLFEEYNVGGCIAYWNLSNSLNELTADNNQGNGAWWLYKWYGDMSGQYLPISVSHTPKDNYYGVASLDDNKKSANVIFGGVSGSSNIVLDDVNGTDTFKDSELVHVKLEATDYTGYHGAAEEPLVVKEGAVEVVDGQVTIPVSDMNDMSAYRITVTKATEDETAGFLSTTWKQKYEAEQGLLSGAATVSSNDLACSGKQKVGWIIDEGDMIYHAANGCNSADPSQNKPYTGLQNLIIDGEFVEQMVLPSTVKWTMGGMYSTYIQLSAGTHKIKITGTYDPRTADVDCIYLTYKGPNESDTDFEKTYEAELCEFNELAGNSTALRTERNGNIDYVSGLEKTSVTNGGGLRFNAIVSEDGMYTLKLRYASTEDSNANIYLNNDTVNLDNLIATLSLENTQGAWSNGYQTVFLQKGINIIDIDTDAPIQLDYINVKQAAIEPTAVVEAESGSLTGEAVIGGNSDIQNFASKNGYVAGIKAANSVEVIEPDDPDFEIYGRGRVVDLGEAVDKNSLTLTVNVPEAGEYNMAVYQSSGELFGRHDYNAQMTERYASFSVNGGEAQKVVFRNTYSDETFRSQVISVNLNAGENTIKIYNDNSKVVTNGIHKGGDRKTANIDYNVLVNYTPNFDKFVFYPNTVDLEIAEQNTYRITAAASEMGTVSVDKTKVEAGGTVKITFIPDVNSELVDAKINGLSIMDQLSNLGGVYILSDIQTDIEIQGYFKTTDQEKIEETYLYSVNCGDIDPSTLSTGDVFGSNNSVTDQFYGTDPKTGKMWGVVDTPKADAEFPGWLTGERTWPCENQNVTDESTREYSFRLLRNQPTTDPGIIYKFELEPNETYNLELGFYVPPSWTSPNVPRTMKLVLNETVTVNDSDGTITAGDISVTENENTVTVNNRFEASNDYNNPFIIKTTATADENGVLTIRVGHADDAVWGPVVSYIDIMELGDKTELKDAIAQVDNYNEQDYSQVSWDRLQDALTKAISVNENDTATKAEIAKALNDLRMAEEKLVEVEAYNELLQLVEQYQNQQQELTDDDDWYVFKTALENGKFALNSDWFATQDINKAINQLKAAINNLLLADSIVIVQLPNKTDYYVNDAFDPTGLVVEVIDNKGGHHELTAEEYALSGYDLTKAGTVTVTITYQDKLSDTFEIKVSERPVPLIELKEIQITKVSKTEYKVGEEFNKEDIEVTAYYTDNSTKVVTDYEVSGFDSSEEGKKTVTLTYQEGDIIATATLNIIIVTDSQEPGISDNPENDNSNSDSNSHEDTDAVTTGDSNSIAVISMLLCLLGLAGVSVVVISKKKNLF